MSSSTSSSHLSSAGPSTTASSSAAEALRRMTKLVNSLLSRGDSGPFREPVDWRELGLYDYPKIIKKMMDLGTVKRKLERNQYRTANECASDIRLIWTNCKTYNADGSDFFLLAESFSRRFEDRYKKIKAEFDTGDDNDGRGGSAPSSSKTGTASGGGSSVDSSKSSSAVSTPASLDAKANFGSILFKLSGSELGHVVQVIDLRCPQALVDPDPDGWGAGAGDGGGTEVEIDVDAIDPRTFAELDKYVRERVKTPSSTSTSSSADRKSSSRGGGGKRGGKSSAAAAGGSGDDDNDENGGSEEEWQEEGGGGGGSAAVTRKRKR